MPVNNFNISQNLSVNGDTTITGNAIISGSTTIIGNVVFSGSVSSSPSGTTLLSPITISGLSSSSQTNYLVVDGSGNLTYNTSNVSSLNVSDGISGDSTTGAVSIINTDKGSSQNIFKNIQVNGATQFSAGSNSSNLNFSGINMTITSAATNTLVFSAGTAGVSSVTAGSGLSGNSTTGNITLINAGVTSITNGAGISINQSTGNVTITATGGGGGTSLGLVYTTGNNLNLI